jgi:D-alanine-D-alanine ligase
MTRKIQLGVFFGGRSGEHEVSLMSAKSVLSVLDPQKYIVHQVGIDLSGQWWTGKDVLSALEQNDTSALSSALMGPKPGAATLYTLTRGNDDDQIMKPIADLEVIIPVLHGTFGEDGTLQGFFELADVAYVGAGVLGSSVGMDKGIFKDIMRAHDIPVADWIVTTRGDIMSRLDEVIRDAESLGPYPLFIKPANLGSSVGITKAKNRSDLLEGLAEAAEFDRRVLVEKGINAREIEVSVLGNDRPRASIAGEIRPSDEFYSYRAKYLDGKSDLLIPAPISPELMESARQLALKTYLAIDCAGMARIDFLLDQDKGELLINEVNTIPGFTSISMYPKLWEASGISYSQLIDELIELALERKKDRDQTKRNYGD